VFSQFTTTGEVSKGEGRGVRMRSMERFGEREIRGERDSEREMHDVLRSTCEEEAISHFDTVT